MENPRRPPLPVEPASSRVIMRAQVCKWWEVPLGTCFMPHLSLEYSAVYFVASRVLHFPQLIRDPDEKDVSKGTLQLTALLSICGMLTLSGAVCADPRGWPGRWHKLSETKFHLQLPLACTARYTLSRPADRRTPSCCKPPWEQRERLSNCNG